MRCSLPRKTCQQAPTCLRGFWGLNNALPTLSHKVRVALDRRKDIPRGGKSRARSADSGHCGSGRTHSCPDFQKRNADCQFLCRAHRDRRDRCPNRKNLSTLSRIPRATPAFPRSGRSLSALKNCAESRRGTYRKYYDALQPIRICGPGIPRPARLHTSQIQAQLPQLGTMPKWALQRLSRHTTTKSSSSRARAFFHRDNLGGNHRFHRHSLQGQLCSRKPH